MIAYQIDSSWIPDPVYVNAKQGLHYIAWKVGQSKQLLKGLWIIAPVRDSPEPLTNILPPDYDMIEFISDTVRYGHTRIVMVNNSVVELQESFLAEVVAVTNQVTLGNR